jgi:hypothetical protein
MALRETAPFCIAGCSKEDLIQLEALAEAGCRYIPLSFRIQDVYFEDSDLCVT